jgi:hypothetical protein
VVSRVGEEAESDESERDEDDRAQHDPADPSQRARHGVILEHAGGRRTPVRWIAALAAKRLHDRDRSAWWLLFALIPIVGPLWLAITLALRAGTPGDNRFGADPRMRDADYLVVA